MFVLVYVAYHCISFVTLRLSFPAQRPCLRLCKDVQSVVGICKFVTILVKRLRKDVLSMAGICKCVTILVKRLCKDVLGVVAICKFVTVLVKRLCKDILWTSGCPRCRWQHMISALDRNHEVTANFDGSVGR